MNTTWDENRQLLNDFWPVAFDTYTAAELELWRTELSGLDQAALAAAIREVKRTREGGYPQLPWVLAAYRDATASRRKVVNRAPTESHKPVLIDETLSQRLYREFIDLVECSTADDFEDIERRVLDKVGSLEIDMAPAARVLIFAREKLLGKPPVMKRVSGAAETTLDDYTPTESEVSDRGAMLNLLRQQAAADTQRTSPSEAAA